METFDNGTIALFGRPLNLELPTNIATAYVTTIVMAIIPIYVGSYLSLKRSEAMEVMDNKEVWKFPLVGSATLLGLYAVVKFVNPDYVNLVLNLYFLVVGVFALTATFHPLVAVLDSPASKKYKIMIPYILDEPIEYTINDIPLFLMSIGVCTWYLVTKHWVANNILGLTFSIQAISIMSLKNYKIASGLLAGLFFYDIFWVFGTDVMVTVAKSIDAPIKLVFPKDLLAEQLQFSMLGLGDIIIPGFFISLLLRYDSYKYRKNSPFPKPYFNVAFLAYVLALVFTMVVMHTLKAAQPALLYLVPACLISSFLTAFFLKDIKGLLKYDEDKIKVE